MADIIQLRRDTKANWATKNPVLALGETGLETDTRKVKYGDGTTTWNNLPYSGGADYGSYDVSEANNGATYATLQEALAALPVSERKGGMNIRFINTANNSYVQFRYMAASLDDSVFLSASNWQGIDETPTEGSRNLVESGGVAEGLNILSFERGGISEGTVETTDTTRLRSKGFVKAPFSIKGTAQGHQVYLYSYNLDGSYVTHGSWTSSLNIKDTSYKYRVLLRKGQSAEIDLSDLSGFEWNCSLLENVQRMDEILNATAIVARDKTLKLIGMATSASAAGVSAVDDIYYNTSTKKLRRCTVWNTTATNSIYEDVAYIDGGIYNYNGVLYVWDGTDLVPNTPVIDIDAGDVTYDSSANYAEDTVGSVLKSFPNVQFNIEVPCQDSGYIIKSSGNIAASDMRGHTDYINVELYERIYFVSGVVSSIGGTGGQMYAQFYKSDYSIDSNATFSTSNISANGKYLDIPSTAKYVRFNLASQESSIIRLFIKKNIFYIINNTFAKKADMYLEGKTVILCGDSQVGQAASSFAPLVAKKTGATVYNCGFGGCRMSWRTNDGSSPYDAFTMVNVADCLVSGVFTSMDNALENVGSSYQAQYAASLDNLKLLNIGDGDNHIMTIAYGSNDYSENALLGTAESLDKTTLLGAMQYAIQKLLTAFPKLQIVFVGMPYRVYTYETIDNVKVVTSDSDDHTQTIGGETYYRYNYSDAILDNAKKNHLTCFDMYRRCQRTKYNAFEIGIDGVHPTSEYGGKLTAELYVKLLTSF